MMNDLTEDNFKHTVIETALKYLKTANGKTVEESAVGMMEMIAIEVNKLKIKSVIKVLTEANSEIAKIDPSYCNAISQYEIYLHGLLVKTDRDRKKEIKNKMNDEAFENRNAELEEQENGA